MNKQEQLIEKFRESLSNNTFIKFIFSAYFGSEKGMKKAYIKRISIKGRPKFNCVYRFETKDITKNYEEETCINLIEQFLKNDFKNAVLFTSENDWYFEQINEKKQILKKVLPSKKEIPSFNHDKQKNRIIKSIDKKYLHLLNITNSEGLVLKNAQDKYRQINRYIEILSPLIKGLKGQEILEIVDMGSGKGYLTFALYDFLVNTQNRAVRLSGIELRTEMVELCNKIAKECNFDNLNFQKSTIQSYNTDTIDILIALHACDIATDEAIYKGIVKSAQLIVVAPCCHKQIRREMEIGKAKNELDFLIKHGIFLERQSEMITDGIRALILEYYGYKTKIFEFISDVHTPKNVMIVAQKSNNKGRNKDEIMAKIKATKAYFGIQTHYLEELLK